MATKITVNASKAYDVIIENSNIFDALSPIADYFSPSKAMIVTDSNVGALYLSIAKARLVELGFEVYDFTFLAGEESKNAETLISLWSSLASVPFTRSDIIIALGGGVVGDVAGFAAATFLRGIRYVQIPTSLLAMVDSSVGGKTAIDLPEGKNLCGAFCQPSLVLTTTEFLKTLPYRELSSGMAEVIKYAMIGSTEIFELIENGDMESIIAASINAKKRCVEADEFDTGERMLLNFGHTSGHAIEKLSEYKITHGEAVAIGMAIMTRYAEKCGKCTEEELKRLLNALDRFSLLTKTEFSAEEICKIAMADKKRAGDTISLVTYHGKDGCKIEKTDIDGLNEIISIGL